MQSSKYIDVLLDFDFVAENQFKNSELNQHMFGSVENCWLSRVSSINLKQIEICGLCMSECLCMHNTFSIWSFSVQYFPNPSL